MAGRDSTAPRTATGGGIGVVRTRGPTAGGAGGAATRGVGGRGLTGVVRLPAVTRQRLTNVALGRAAGVARGDGGGGRGHVERVGGGLAGGLEPGGLVDGGRRGGWGGAAFGGEEALEGHGGIGRDGAIGLAREEDDGELGGGAGPGEQGGAVVDVEVALGVGELGEGRQRDGDAGGAEGARAEDLVADAGAELGVDADRRGQGAAGGELALDGVVDAAAQAHGRERADGRAHDEELPRFEVGADLRDLHGRDEAHFAERERVGTGRRGDLREPHGPTGCQIREGWAEFFADGAGKLAAPARGRRGGLLDAGRRQRGARVGWQRGYVCGVTV